MQIRSAGIEDVVLIERLAHAIWPQCYKDILSPAQLSYMLNKIYAPAALIHQIQQQDHNFILLYDEGEAVGFADFSEKNPGNSTEYKLHKIYVDTGKQGKGFGKHLLQYVIQATKERGATLLTLNVNRYNKALQFYLNNGFIIDHEDDIDIGEGYFMNDYIMTKQL